MSRAMLGQTENIDAARLFRSQLYQVLRSYFSKWYSWLIAANWLFSVIFLLLFERFRPNVSAPERLRHLIMVALIANWLLGMVLGLKLKSQFCNPRARLLPNFAMAHLMVAGVIAVAAMTLEWALLLGWGGFGSQLAIRSLIFLAMIVCVWACYLMDMRAIGLIIIFGFGMSHVPGKYLAGLIQTLGDNPLLSLLILCIGLAATAALGRRLWRIDEETPEYSRMSLLDLNYNLTLGDAKQRRRKRAAHALADTLYHVRLRDRLFGLVFRKPVALSPWRHLVLRQLATGFPGLFWIPFQIGMVVYMVWLSTWMGDFHDEQTVFWSLFMPFFMAISMCSGMLRNRWPYLAHESLLPMDRKGFVRNMARSSTLDMAALFVGHSLGYLLTLALFRAPKPLVEILPFWFVLTAVQYALGYCLMLWLASFRGFWVYLIGILVLSGFLAILDAMAVDVVFGKWPSWEPTDTWLILGLIFTVAMAMVIFYRSAFRRWCQVDLG